MDSQDWDDRYAAEELVWGAGPNLWVVRELTGHAPGHALDIATGEGRNAIWLAGQGWDVTGLDFSAVAVERAERLTAELPDDVADRLTWRHDDARTFDPPAAGYDLVLVAYLQVPARDRRAALRRAADALAPGGTLLVIGHDLRNLAEGVGGPQDPRVLYGPEDVLADVADHGLTVVRAESVLRPVGGDPGHEGRAGQGGGGAGDTAVDVLVRLERGAA
ncbi:class I SAM-dependent methyltransferase [Kitasatospora sp. NPDC048722]|uniref:class I SAM-dependent methyltransferase n=1 Tax=Kitasatospora sp. NPDC048722 TaxID=3155639 RepID=UPI0033ECF9C6